MLRLVFPDGRAFEAPTFVELVETMRQAALVAPATRRRYMKDVKHRVRIWTGRTIEYTTEREFCLALVGLGLATLEGEEELA